MNRWVLLGYGAIAVVGAASVWAVIDKSEDSFKAARDSYRTIALAESKVAARNLETKIDQIYQNIRTISFLPSVQKIDRHGRNLDSDALLSIQQIYNNLANSVSVSEVYIVPIDMDPDRIDPDTGKPEEPILMFDELITEHSPGEARSAPAERPAVEEVEIHEYRQLAEQQAWLSRHHPTRSSVSGLQVPVISGPEVITCDNSVYARTLDDADRFGLIFSVPFYGPDGALKGMISAIIRTAALRQMLPSTDAALVNTGYGATVFSVAAGQEQVSNRFVAAARPDPNLVFSTVLPVASADPRSSWTMWFGHPDRDFLASSEVVAIRDFETAGTAGAILLALIAAALWAAILRARAAAEVAGLQGLADAAVEGLAICDGDKLVAANHSFETLVGVKSGALVGAPIGALFDGLADFERIDPDSYSEARLKRAGGDTIPVELISRPVSYAGRSHRVLAIRDLSERKTAEAHIRFLALHDSLTGLPNRAQFNARLEAELVRHQREQAQLAVLCLDLDRFKEINDLFGHAAGDAVLQAFAGAVVAVIGADTLFARLGGDEFALILPNLSGIAAAAALAEAVLEAVQARASGDAAGALGVSIGVALYPDDGADRTALLSHADTALYRAKSEGRGTYRFFEAAMGAELREHRLLEHDLRHALQRGEIRLVYQPQTMVSSGDYSGFEALMRWDHPIRGPVSPATFIPIAEESGLILQLGEWALRTACAEAAAWPHKLRIAVNISPVQLHAGDLPHLVHEILLATGLAPGRLELEVTETALIRDFDRAVAGLRQLKALGVRIAMDDFGTGYSSLSNLRAFPFDKIKIDRSFVAQVDRNQQSAAIVRAVVGLGRGLNLPVLAEGVETAGELDFLTGELCSEVQGYLIGRPADIGSFGHVTHPSEMPAAPPRAAAGRA